MSLIVIRFYIGYLLLKFLCDYKLNIDIKCEVNVDFKKC